MRSSPIPPGRRTMEAACRAVALVGCVALVAVMLVVVASVLGSNLFRHPILGDTEIVDSLTGVVVFCFLPWCHLHGGNVIVDFFAKPLPRVVRDWLDVVMNLAFAVVAGVIAWRLMAGGLSAFTREQASMFLEIPEWWVYAVGSLTSVLWIVVILYVAYESVLRARGRLSAPADEVQFG
ncbi:TRAP transporter small permease [Rhodoplanes sp. TEM]|uniref:TRAP transporter small permease protein n=1 Tax=Rhodoplanes tepidamans TaxID=200616 RepID=A0ABT5J4I4_RHOTP|nr:MULTISPECIES: TRAP transporter small permease [Rhodoplanes]MDC7784357.1 TRAP transporter small permease [Rhodoplanes tepidamans]MDC7983379.1 TRAP transporter small permease [Rhodoplanes sp. TEM]MDQ0354515.1 TRAP-type C4-dicarboxylate transport system permease small subunit [Rhodoplanes tepidamans]